MCRPFPDKAQSKALQHMVGTFFGGSVEQAVMALCRFRTRRCPKAISRSWLPSPRSRTRRQVVMQTSGLTLLVDAALKGTAVLLSATALVVLLRRGSAASRHLIWQFAVFAVLCLPVIKVISPWQLAVLPQWRSPIVRADVGPAPSVKEDKSASTSASARV
jgi:hypothetical protein